jgi:uncharacterized protein YjbI with pentapeptide repeats
VNPTKRNSKRFSIRTLLGVTVVLAVVMGWLVTLQELRITKGRMSAASARTQMIESHIESIYGEKYRERNHGRGFMSGMNLDGCDFRGVTINADTSAFQATSLQNANLQNATITAGGSSFQSVSFDHADLRGAKLSASGAAFQMVTFVEADLRGAKLIGGNGSEFQAVSFRGADLTGATITCGGAAAFSAVDIDSANFSDADLSAIDADNLHSAYYSTPPNYSTKTKFPADFDPKKAGWTLADQP